MKEKENENLKEILFKWSWGSLVALLLLRYGSEDGMWVFGSHSVACWTVVTFLFVQAEIFSYYYLIRNTNCQAWIIVILVLSLWTDLQRILTEDVHDGCRCKLTSSYKIQAIHSNYKQVIKKILWSKSKQQLISKIEIKLQQLAA